MVVVSRSIWISFLVFLEPSSAVGSVFASDNQLIDLGQMRRTDRSVQCALNSNYSHLMPPDRPLPRASVRQEPERLTLDALRANDRGTILGVDAGEALYHRLAALGLRVGKSVRLLRRAPLGGPLQVRLGMTEIMLRPEEARCVRVAREAGT